METRGALPDEQAMSPACFCEFYRTHLPSVYGYLLRLCAGDRARAEDLTQDVWLALVDELNQGHVERADVRWLLRVARSRFVDQARRDKVVRSKLALLRRFDDGNDPEPSSGEVLDRLGELQPLHRAVLILRYVDALPVPEVAETIGRELTATNSLLARARAELRRLGRGDDDA